MSSAAPRQPAWALVRIALGPALLLAALLSPDAWVSNRVRACLEIGGWAAAACWLPLRAQLYSLMAVAMLSPDGKLHLDMLGGSPLSSTTGANPWHGELGGAILAAAALPRRWRNGKTLGRARLACLAWALWLGLAFAWGLAQGHALRSALIDLRALGWIFPMLLILELEPDEIPRVWGFFLVLALAKAVLGLAMMAAEPAAHFNPHILPWPMPMADHSESVQIPAAALLLALCAAPGLFAWPGPARWAAGLLLAALLFASLMRGAWIVLAAALAGAAVFSLSRKKTPWPALGRSALTALLGVVLALALTARFSADLAFFQVQRLYSLVRGLPGFPGQPHLDAGSSPFPLSSQALAYFRSGLHARVVQQGRDASVNERRNLALDGWRQFRERPVLGQGLGSTFESLRSRGLAVRYTHPHSAHIWVAAVGGLLGLGLWLVLLAVPLRALARAPGGEAAGLAFGLWLFVLLMGALFWLTHSSMVFWGGFLMAMSLRLARHRGATG